MIEMQRKCNYIAVTYWLILSTHVHSHRLTETLLPGKLSTLTEDERYDLVFRWCAEYDPCNNDSLQPLNLSEQDQKDEVVIRVKQSLGITSSNSELTDELMLALSRPRCAESKETKHRRQKRFSRLGSLLWKSKNLPLGIKFKNYAQGIKKQDQEAIAMHCANLWGNDSSLSFRMVARDPNIEIKFSYIDGPFSTVGRGQSPTPYHNPPTTYMTLDTSERWKLRKTDRGSGVSLTWAICHEMGHNLGLSHSKDPKAIMYPSRRQQDENRLGTDDLSGIRHLYPSNRKSITKQGNDGQSKSRPPVKIPGPSRPRKSRPSPSRRQTSSRRTNQRLSNRRTNQKLSNRRTNQRLSSRRTSTRRYRPSSRYNYRYRRPYRYGYRPRYRSRYYRSRY